MIKDLAKLATRLDRLGLTKEADVLDAALNKLAQEVATTGAPGSHYVGGKKQPYQRPLTYVEKFYHSKPKDLAEFNQYLGEIIKNIAALEGQRQFSPQVVNNPPSKTDTTWTSKTQAAFKEYANAAGFPDAGQDWQAFAQKNGYEPTLLGIYRFWVDTIEKVESKARQDLTPSKNLQERAESLARGPQEYLNQLGATPIESPSAQGAQGRLRSINIMESLETRLNSYPIKDTLREGLNAAYLFKKLQSVMSKSQAANDWFTKNPLDTVLPPNINEILTAKITAEIATNSDGGVNEFYRQLLENLGNPVSTKQKYVPPDK